MTMIKKEQGQDYFNQQNKAYFSHYITSATDYQRTYVG